MENNLEFKRKKKKTFVEQLPKLQNRMRRRLMLFRRKITTVKDCLRECSLMTSISGEFNLIVEKKSFVQLRGIEIKSLQAVVTLDSISTMSLDYKIFLNQQFSKKIPLLVRIQSCRLPTELNLYSNPWKLQQLNSSIQHWLSLTQILRNFIEFHDQPKIDVTQHEPLSCINNAERLRKSCKVF